MQGFRAIRSALTSDAFRYGCFAAALVSPLALAAGYAQAETRVTYAGSTAAPNVAAAYYTSLPKVLGYWKAEDLEVVQSDFSGSGPVVQSIHAGSVDVGVVGTKSMFSAIQNGVGITGYYAVVPHQYAWPAVLPDSPIKDVGDLIGKTFGVPSLESATVEGARAYVALAGGDPANVKFLSVGTGADAMIALQRGDVDALMLWDGPYAEIEQRGQPLRLLQDSELATNAGYQSVVIARKQALKDDPKAYVGFARAIAKSLVFIRANPECAVYAHWHSYPASRPNGVAEKQALEQAVRIWKAREPHTGEVDGKWGYNTEAQVLANLKIQELANIVKPGLTAGDVADFSLIDEINDFDAAAVEAQARACDFPWRPK